MKLVAVVIALVLATAGCGSAASPSPRPDGSPVPATPPTATAPATRGGATDAPPTGGLPRRPVLPGPLQRRPRLRRQRRDAAAARPAGRQPVAPRHRRARHRRHARRTAPGFVPTVARRRLLRPPAADRHANDLAAVAGGDDERAAGSTKGPGPRIGTARATRRRSCELTPGSTRSRSSRAGGDRRVVLDRLGYGASGSTAAMATSVGRSMPYDAIIVTAAPDHLPPPLVAQLDPDGVAGPDQAGGRRPGLWLVTRQGDEVAMERVLGSGSCR